LRIDSQQRNAESAAQTGALFNHNLVIDRWVQGAEKNITPRFKRDFVVFGFARGQAATRRTGKKCLIHQTGASDPKPKRIRYVLIGDPKNVIT
jgi:hypothetical protein